ncbi:hypothetical protein [Francisella tularensis]|uniref:hypothetical protein n=1 Tax=Francisella tularensis TaxID=263 RepID=UPI0016817778|nr:hypothetical protein [Francisella tularensis]MBD2809122.1 hypothetical protein [Francisella tularensis]
MSEAAVVLQNQELIVLIVTGSEIFTSFYKIYAKSLNNPFTILRFCENLLTIQILKITVNANLTISYMLV